MKKFKLDLSVYQVEAQVEKTVEGKREISMEAQDYPLRENISNWLRGTGIFKTGEEICEAITLAKDIRDIEADSMLLDEREAEILKRGINKHIELTAVGRAGLGGPVHEEAICRVFGMKEVD